MKNIFLYILLLGLIISCSLDEENRPSLEVGNDFIESNIRVLSIDSFQVELSTFKFDSINSSDTNRLLVGRYEDEHLGTVESTPYFQLRGRDFEIDNDAELDSVALILGYDNYFYNDTTLVNKIDIHRITERFQIDDNIFYNTSTLQYDPEVLISRLYAPRPIEEDSLHISFSTPFTQTIFERIRDGDIDDNDELQQELRGLVLKAGATDNGSVIGFSLNQDVTHLRFYYKIPGELDDETDTYDLSIIPNELPYVFNNIRSEVTGNLTTLDDQEINLLASENDGISYVQAGVGYATRIRFPSIRKIEELSPGGTILNARLQLRPIDFSGILPLTDSLNVSILDAENVITEPVIFSGLGATLAGLNEVDPEFNERIYEFPVGSYIDTKIGETNIVDDALVIFQREFNTNVDRSIIDTRATGSLYTKLIITYAIYDEE